MPIQLTTHDSDHNSQAVLSVRNRRRITKDEGIWDTGATGIIVSESTLLTGKGPCAPTNYNGLNGSLIVTQAGQLADIGRVHYDPRAGMTVISASECLKLGHSYEYRRGPTIEDDAFLLHTAQHTYVFRYREGLYVANLSNKAAPRYKDAPPSHEGHLHQHAITPQVIKNIVYVAKLPTTDQNEQSVSQRQLERSIGARKLQASLGFPSDSKLIRALNAGTFLNCPVLPEDVTRATKIWGPNVASIQGKTNRVRPYPPPQNTLGRRNIEPQEMHCDIMFVNKMPVVISLTQPIGVIQVACVTALTTPILRPVIRRFFGMLNEKNIDVVRFTSDNEKGLAALFSDMGAMSVEQRTVGPGQHDHSIERAIRTFKEELRTIILSLPFNLADVLLPHLILAAAKKLLFFGSRTRLDQTTPFEALFNRKADLRIDIGPPCLSYCHATRRDLKNNMEPRTVACLYLEPRMNGTGTYSFISLDNKAVFSANHYVVLPITPLVTATVNSWAARNKLGATTEPTFTWKDKDIADWSDALDDDAQPPQPPGPRTDTPIPRPFGPTGDSPDPLIEPPPVDTTGEPRGEQQVQDHDEVDEDNGEPASAPADPEPAVQEIENEPADLEPAVLQIPTQDPHPEPDTFTPRRSQRVRKPPSRYLSVTTHEEDSSMEELIQQVCGMTTTKALKQFPKEALEAMRSEITSLLGKSTFDGVMIHELSPEQKKKILRTIMNVTEKWLPDLDEKGTRMLDKIKARFCVDGRGQDRAEYAKEEIESPTAYFISICTVAQIAAQEKRFVCVGDVGTAYLNATMPSHDPKKHVHVMINKDVADIMCEIDPSFKPYQAKSGRIVARLRKALYGCIESAKLWHLEITKTLTDWGFTPNPRDPCVLNKVIRGKQLTVVIYVDDLLMTCVYVKEVRNLAEDLRSKYGQFRTSDGPIVNFLGTKLDYREEGFVLLLQLGMIQNLIASRENTLRIRGAALKANVHSPGASYLFERSEGCQLLNDKDKATYHTDVATALYIGQRSRPDINTAVGELCKRVKSPTTEDDSKLDRLIAYLKTTRDIPLRLGYTSKVPRVIVSIDAAFANRAMMKSTSGVCITLGTGFFMASSKIQKINTKSSTEAEIIAVSDGMNVPMWLADFLKYQGHEKQTIQVHQDNQSCIALLTKGRSTAETTRFIAIRHYWISYYIFTKVVELIYVPTEEMVSDYFTKPLQGILFEKMVKRILGKK